MAALSNRLLDYVDQRQRGDPLQVHPDAICVEGIHITRYIAEFLVEVDRSADVPDRGQQEGSAQGEPEVDPAYGEMHGVVTKHVNLFRAYAQQRRKAGASGLELCALHLIVAVCYDFDKRRRCNTAELATWYFVAVADKLVDGIDRAKLFRLIARRYRYGIGARVNIEKVNFYSCLVVRGALSADAQSESAFSRQ